MNRVPAYDMDAYRRAIDVDVRAAGTDDAGPFAVLDDTVLYPGGGGQPGDRGRLAGVLVLGVARGVDGFRHSLEAPVETGPAKLDLDWARRYDHMQQHTAQHLLSAIAADRFGWKTDAFHLGVERADIELDVAVLGDEELRALEDAVLAAVREARAVRVRRVTVEEYEGLDVRTRGLPPGHEGDVRLVEIEGIDRASCGGTHLASTAEIESMKLLGTEPMRGGTRLHWVAGGRVRSRLDAHEMRTTALRRLFGTPDHELVDAAAARLLQLEVAERRLRFLESRLAQEVGGALARSDALLVDAHFDAMGAAYVRAVASAFSAAAGARVALLTASSQDGDFFAVAAGPDAGTPPLVGIPPLVGTPPLVRFELSRIGAEVAEILEGRGGGKGLVFQGKAGTLARRADALARLKSARGAGG